MRKLVVLSLFLASSAFAQSGNTFSVFISNPTYTHSESAGTTTEGGFGVGIERQVKPNLSLALTAGLEKYTLRESGVRRDYRIVPIDALVRYHFFGGRAVSPYIGGGARYVRKPDIELANSRFTAQAVAGADFRVTEKFGIFVDVKRLLAEPGPRYDERTKLAAGVRWRF